MTFMGSLFTFVGRGLGVRKGYRMGGRGGWVQEPQSILAERALCFSWAAVFQCACDNVLFMAGVAVGAYPLTHSTGYSVRPGSV